MVHPEEKYLIDLKKRVEYEPDTVTYRMLVRAIPAEIHGKLVPQFVKNEICRCMAEVKEFVAANGWARKPVTESLLKLYHAVVDVKRNHEGYVRVEYADFRETLDKVRAQTLPRQMIEMPSNIKEKLFKIRGGGQPVMPALKDEDALTIRRALVDSPTIQHYRARGVRIVGSMSEDIDVPKIVAHAADVLKLIDETRRYAKENKIPLEPSVRLAIISAETVVKHDALWCLMFTSIEESLKKIFKVLITENADRISLDLEAKRILDTVLPWFRRLEDWAKTEQINQFKLKAAANRNHVTPDEMLMQAKKLLNKNPDDCL